MAPEGCIPLGAKPGAIAADVAEGGRHNNHDAVDGAHNCVIGDAAEGVNSSDHHVRKLTMANSLTKFAGLGIV